MKYIAYIDIVTQYVDRGLFFLCCVWLDLYLSFDGVLDLCFVLVVFNNIASFRKKWGGLEKGRLFLYVVWNSLSAFSTDTSCQLDVLWHDGDTLGVDGAQVGVLEESD